MAANEVWAKALADAEELRRSAQQEAAAVGEEAAQKGQESIEAAEVVREKILTDLTRRRKLATVQIEQLRAGRERLLDAYLVVRRTLDEVTDELQRADAEARAAAVAVGRMDRDEQTGELVDLRREDHWDSLAAFGGAEPVAHAGDQKTTAETPVVLAPKVSQVAPAAAVASAPAVAPAPAVATAPPPKATHDLPVEDNTVVSRTDAIESVRIVRTGPNGADTTTVEAPEEVTLPPKAEVTTEEEAPASSPGTEDADGEASQGKDVQGLFARLRENRDQATRAARKTLRDTGGQETSETETIEPESIGPVSSQAEATQNGVDQADGENAGPQTKVEVAGNGAAAAVNQEELLAVASGTDLDAGERLLERQDAVTRDLGSSLARKLKRALQDEQNSLLDRLRSLKGTATPAKVLPDADEHPDHFADAGRPLLQQAAQAGAKVASELCGNEVPERGRRPAR